MTISFVMQSETVYNLWQYVLQFGCNSLGLCVLRFYSITELE